MVQGRRDRRCQPHPWFHDWSSPRRFILTGHRAGDHTVVAVGLRPQRRLAVNMSVLHHQGWVVLVHGDVADGADEVGVAVLGAGKALGQPGVGGKVQWVGPAALDVQGRVQRGQPRLRMAMGGAGVSGSRAHEARQRTGPAGAPRAECGCEGWKPRHGCRTPSLDNSSPPPL